MLSAVVVAGRSGAAIAAELGSMVVTEQIEALDSARALADPHAGRAAAGRDVVMLPMFTVLADIV